MSRRHLGSFLLALFACLVLAPSAAAHCDTMRGPVVTAARAALEAGDPKLFLHWVRPEDEAAVRAAFQHTLEVRATGPAAKELADRYFFETLVRIHRGGEGAPYTGLTDGEPEPIIAATDSALEHGSAEKLERQLVTAVRTGLAERFAAARATKNFRPDDVAAGRAFVAAYVPLTHWVEGVFTAATERGEHEAAGEHHAVATHVLVHRGAGHADTGGAAETHDRGGLSHLPWILAGALAIVALFEAVFLVRPRRSTAA